MRKSEYEAMLIDDLGKTHDPLELDTAWKVMDALKEMEKRRNEEKNPSQNATEKNDRRNVLYWFLNRKKI